MYLGDHIHEGVGETLKAAGKCFKDFQEIANIRWHQISHRYPHALAVKYIRLRASCILLLIFNI